MELMSPKSIFGGKIPVPSAKELEALENNLATKAREKLVSETVKNEGSYMTFRDGVLGYASFAAEAGRQFMDRDLTDPDLNIVLGVLEKNWDDCSAYVLKRVKDMMMNTMRETMHSQKDGLPCYVPDEFVIDLIHEFYVGNVADTNSEKKEFDAACEKRSSAERLTKKTAEKKKTPAKKEPAAKTDPKDAPAEGKASTEEAAPEKKETGKKKSPAAKKEASKKSAPAKKTAPDPDTDEEEESEVSEDDS